MTYRLLKGNLLECDQDLIVIPVNMVGVAGAGLALAARCKYPRWYDSYKKFSNGGRWEQCAFHVYQQVWDPGYIVSLPTKTSWRLPSDIELIRKGLTELKWYVTREDIKMFALPLLGCGLGGLDPNDVLEVIDEVFNGRYWPHVYVMPNDAGRIKNDDHYDGIRFAS